MASGNAYFNALISDTARSEVLGMPNVPSPIYSSDSFTAQLEAMRQGRVQVHRKGPNPYIKDIDWSISDFGRYYSTQLHGLVGIGSLLNSTSRLTNDIERKIADYLTNWSLCAAHNPTINSRSWFEGTVVKRQSNLLGVLNYLRQYGSIADFKYEDLIYLIHKNAEFLLDTEDIYSYDNHGIRQDTILAATALHLPSHPRSKEMLAIAEKRLNAAAHNLFSSEGIWLEHAPGYTNYILRLMQDIKVLDDYSEEFNAGLFLSRQSTSAEFLLKSLTPDLKIPWIGSSAATNLSTYVRKILVAADGESIETKVSKLSNSIHHFPHFGHAIVRGQHPDGFYMIFIASQNLPAGKRHADDLSFLLHNHGRFWITEGGHQSYELTGMTRYLRSPYAHNTYVLGDEYIGAYEEPNLKTYLKKVDQKTGKIRMVGFSERFPDNASFERTISIDKGHKSLQIIDTLHSQDSMKKWRGFLHFPPDLTIDIDNNIIFVKDSTTNRIMELSFKSNRSILFQKYFGQKKPLKGWGMHDYKIGPVTTLEFTVAHSDNVTIDIRWR